MTASAALFLFILLKPYEDQAAYSASALVHRLTFCPSDPQTTPFLIPTEIGKTIRYLVVLSTTYTAPQIKIV